MIAHKGILGKAYPDNDKFEQNKEVDEWLMGSGESDATAGSSTSNVIAKKQQELEKPIQPSKTDEMESDDDEDWMFKTFKAVNPPAPDTKPNRLNERNRMIEQDNIENEFGESPFDMAPEMNKQFSRMPVVKAKKNDFDMLDDLVSECNDLN